jgi:2-amino-4-hydroxy-6-hydroxymethyldihydropteridine diphosphokinase
MNCAYLGLGSNLGNRLAFLRSGRDTLAERHDIVLLRAAGVYETNAVGGPPENPAFLNTVLEIETSAEPQQLLATCLAVEDEFGRTRPARWAPRTLDIDILFFADQIIHEANLTIPHPALHERSFVLAPLREIAPDLRHPLMDKTVGELAEACAGINALEPMRASW